MNQHEPARTSPRSSRVFTANLQNLRETRQRRAIQIFRDRDSMSALVRPNTKPTPAFSAPFSAHGEVHGSVERLAVSQLVTSSCLDVTRDKFPQRGQSCAVKYKRRPVRYPIAPMQGAGARVSLCSTSTRRPLVHARKSAQRHQKIPAFPAKFATPAAG